MNVDAGNVALCSLTHGSILYPRKHKQHPTMTTSTAEVEWGTSESEEEKEKKMFETIFQPLYFDKLKNESKRCKRARTICVPGLDSDFTHSLIHSVTRSLPVIYRFSNMYFFLYFICVLLLAAATVFVLVEKSTLESLWRAQRSARNAQLNQDRFWAVEHPPARFQNQHQRLIAKWDKLYYFRFRLDGIFIPQNVFFSHEIDAHSVDHITTQTRKRTHTRALEHRIGCWGVICQSMIIWCMAHIVRRTVKETTKMG